MNHVMTKAAELVDQMRGEAPLVHQITNYVTAGDCANITLAIGASPIMADDISEAAEITALASALVINLGTLNERTLDSMIASGKKANELNIPVILDPVGAGASALRNSAAQSILSRIRIAVLRGNLSEISFVAGLKAKPKGVDASRADLSYDAAAVAKKAAERTGCVVAVTGAVDVVSDGGRMAAIRNGHAMMSKVTGTGCMSTALTGAFAGITDDYFIAAAAGLATLGIAGEMAWEKAGMYGTGSFRGALIDAVSLLDRRTFERRAKIDET